MSDVELLLVLVDSLLMSVEEKKHDELEARLSEQSS